MWKMLKMNKKQMNGLSIYFFFVVAFWFLLFGLSLFLFYFVVVSLGRPPLNV